MKRINFILILCLVLIGCNLPNYGIVTSKLKPYSSPVPTPIKTPVPTPTPIIIYKEVKVTEKVTEPVNPTHAPAREPIKIELFPNEGTAGIDSKITFKATVFYNDGTNDNDVIFDVSDKRIAEVDETGSVKFKGSGVVKIIAISKTDKNIKAESTFKIGVGSINSYGGGGTTIINPILTISLNSTSGIIGMNIRVDITNGTFLPVTAQGPYVIFNEINATPLEVNEKNLIVKIPVGATTGPIKVVLPDGRELDGPSRFVILAGAPSITLLDKTSAIRESNITVTGINFSPTATDNILSFGGVAATISGATETQLTVTVPDNAISGTVPIGVTSVGGTAIYGIPFCVLDGPPVINDFYRWGVPLEKSAYPDEEIDIEGTNFSTNTFDNTVLFAKKGGGTTQGTVVTSNGTTMKVTVPLDVAIGKISVQTDAGQVTSLSDFIPQSEIAGDGGFF